jgi:hypothetical protein
MISQKCLSKEWIESKRSELKPVDPGLLDKCIHAFVLLCGLADSGLPFVFKGGTSLVLLLKTIRRLSIDIDISMLLEKANYEPVLKEIGQTAPFVRYEEDFRGERGLPKRTHFKFFYNSCYSSKPTYVLLDILEEKNLYPQTILYPVQAPFMEMERDISVRVPTLEGLLGDKLNAFAPETVGVKYNPDNSMQIIKQLFDVGELFNAVDNLAAISEAYEFIFEAENIYRGGIFNKEQALDDTIQASLKICGINLKGLVADEQSNILLDGIKKISSHLVNTRFRLEEAKIAASKAVLVAAAIKAGKVDKPLSELRFNPDQISDLKSLSLTGELSRFNKLISLTPEAFHNLYITQSL